MRAILLTCESPFQIACANRLFRAGVVQQVVIERGQSLPREWLTVRDVAWYLKGVWRARQMANLLNHRRYYGHRAMHNRRLLHHDQMFDAGLRVVRVHDINASATIEESQAVRPQAIFVHGTRLIRRPVLEAVGVPLVNLHWGWSPRYRAEGIVSALALEGPQALGVTVHLLDAGIDSGPILYQARPTLDALDNFYSLAVKLTLLGTELFIRVAEDFSRQGLLHGTPQAINPSQLFSSHYLRQHPELYPLAWRNLERAKRDLSPQPLPTPIASHGAASSDLVLSQEIS